MPDLVRPAWGYPDKVVPFGRYETRLGKEQLDGLLRLFREQKIWEVERAVQPPLEGELDFSLVAGTVLTGTEIPNKHGQKLSAIKEFRGRNGAAHGKNR